MLKKTTMQEIFDMKMKGYSVNEVIEYYEAKPGKPPSRPTIRKYYNMDAIPDDPGVNLVKDKVFDVEPWKSAIITILKNNPKKIYGSSVYDVLEEHFIENGEYDCLPGSDRTLRTYISYLLESGQVERAEPGQRIYEHVFDTPPGQQMQVDFGELRIKKGLEIHFICMLLRYSRYILVFAQDHKFNSEEACRTLYHGFCKLGGRPEELVIDQDTVFITSEYLGEIIESQTFKDFIKEQGLSLWVCNKGEAESKGGVEALVKFVKMNFFSARKITCIEDVWQSLPGWLERKNKRIHRATFCVPRKVFSEIEKPALRPLLPSVYDAAPSSFIAVGVNNQPFVTYKSSRYSVPRSFCFKTVYYKPVGEKLHIYGPDRKYECSHDISPRKGSVEALPEHKKADNTGWKEVCERMRERWNCYDFQHFINGFKKENQPRHLFKQLSAVEALLEAENPPRDLVANVMAECCRNFRYQYTQFKAVYDRMKAESIPVSMPVMDAVQKVTLESYQLAFLERCENK